MTFRLVDTGWDTTFRDAVCAHHSSVRIICPFIKTGSAERLLAFGKPPTLELITRFNLVNVCAGVSDLAALRLLLQAGAKIRGVKNLHAKVYLFDDNQVIVTSANLTEAALLRNHEFGFVAEEPEIVSGCRKYFDELWRRAPPNLTLERLAAWEARVKEYLARGSPPLIPLGLGDEGVNAGLAPEPLELPAFVGEAKQAFIKFFGESHNRALRSMPVLDEVRRSGSHWACTYPKGKRPRQVKEGALMFMGRMVKKPNDTIIYGRATALRRHIPGLDDATTADIEDRKWKVKWPHYVRVHDAEFIPGTLADGVSMSELMNTLQSNAFAVTQRNALKKNRNVDPRRAYRQQPHVDLTSQATEWLNERLQRAFDQFGMLPRADLAKLDWPATVV